jgi:hypothetical protein
MIVFSLLLLETILRICGVAVGKYPELQASIKRLVSSIIMVLTT